MPSCRHRASPPAIQVIHDHGCSPALLAVADSVAYIPLIGRVGSLNVAAAAAIALAEARRREWSA